MNNHFRGGKVFQVAARPVKYPKGSTIYRAYCDGVRPMGIAAERGGGAATTGRKSYGGEAGIRTLVTLARKTAFEAAAFNHSATSPRWEREV